jgi:hypothetical protein
MADKERSCDDNWSLENRYGRRGTEMSHRSEFPAASFTLGRSPGFGEGVRNVPLWVRVTIYPSTVNLRAAPIPTHRLDEFPAREGR